MEKEKKAFTVDLIVSSPQRMLNLKEKQTTEKDFIMIHFLVI